MGTRTWLVSLLLAVALLAACRPLPFPTPADTPTPTPTLAPTATPTPTLTPTPVPPTSTPPLQRKAQPIPTPFPPSTITSSGDVAFAGAPLAIQLDIFQPWERLRLVYTSPVGVQGTTILRADEKGRVLWRRETNTDAVGEWRLSIERSGGKPPHTLTYRLTEAEIPLAPTPAPLDEDKRFLLFETGDARVFFHADVHIATAVAVAAYYSAALPQIEAYVGVPLPEKTDFYLVRGQARLIEEVRLGGGSEFTHVEGISLAGPGYRRPGVYLDVAPPESELPLLVVHEAVHQVVARVSRTRPPVWVDEGLADYMGYLVSKEAFPYEAAAWRRAVRASVRRAAQQDGALLSLATLNEPKGWAGGSEEEVTLRYAQAYVAMDYLLERSGLASLRSLFHQVRLGAAGSVAVEAAYGLSLEEVWAGVLADLTEPTSEEREAAALADYARATLALLREEGETRRAWTAFARQSTLPRREREERDLSFLETYREHQRRLEAVRPPEEAQTVQELARRGMKEMAEAMSSFLLYERTGDRSLLADGNERVPQGALLADAASDLLVILLGERRVSLDEAAL